eukprot:m51a1_g11789 hypothetical protein (210) ;mRNA; f:303573-304431
MSGIAERRREAARKKLEADSDPMKWDKKKMDEVWNTFDFNGNGKLSLAEIDRACLLTMPQFYKHKHVIMRAYKAADKSQDGYIEKNEFAALLNLLCYFDDVWKKFEQLDKSKDDRVTFDEFREGYDMLGIPLDDKDLEREFADMDENGGGYVLFDEFCIWAAKKLASKPPEGYAATGATAGFGSVQKARVTSANAGPLGERARARDMHK